MLREGRNRPYRSLRKLCTSRNRRSVEHGSKRLLDELTAGQLDLALITTSGTTSAEQITLTQLLTEELVLISSANAPKLTTGSTMTLVDVASLPQIVFSQTYDLRSATDAAFAAAGITPDVMLDGAEMDAVLRFVERGLGVAIVPAMVLLDRPGLRSVRREKPVLNRTISLAHTSDIAPTAAVTVMQGTITATALAFAARAGASIRSAHESLPATHPTIAEKSDATPAW